MASIGRIGLCAKGQGATLSLPSEFGDWHFAGRSLDAASPAQADAPRLPGTDAPLVIDLFGLTPSQGFIIQGDAASDYAGRSVSDAGDVNGDGFDDLLVGAPGGDDGGTGAGEAYVIFGKAGGFANIDLTSFTPSDPNHDPAAGFIIQGDYSGDQAGVSVSSAGDVDGDGFDDLIVAGAFGDDGGSAAGEAYVIFGKASGFAAVLDLTTFNPADPNHDPADGFIIQGDTAFDNAGYSVSSAGDVNGDGFADIIIGARAGDDGGTGAGEAYVVFGKASGFAAVLDLTTFNPADPGHNPANGFIIQGDLAGDYAGVAVSDAGDVNGDGFGDIIVGAPRGDDGGPETGEAYVIFGKASGFANIDLTSLAASAGFIIQGDIDFDAAGTSVGAAGDVNGDGFEDVIVGAEFGDNGGSGAGEAYVIFGKAGPFGNLDGANRRVVDLTGLETRPAEGFIIQGDTSGDGAGKGVSGIGDFNGDGLDDLLVGAIGSNLGGNNAGAAYVVFGKTGDFGTIDLTGLDEEDGIIIQGDFDSDLLGRSVSGAGDVNDDGFADLIVGAEWGDNGGFNAGEAYVIFGFGASVPTIPGGAGADSLIGGAAAEVLDGAGGADTLQGNGGGDTLDGGAGSDWADYRAGVKVRADLKSPGANTGDAAGDVYLSIENLRGSNGKDKLYGDDLANRIEGRGGTDVLNGRGGKDSLAGGAGGDTLTGGGQNDRFELASVSAADADVIADFASGDTIALDSDVFGLPEGALAAGRFVIGGAAQDANDRLIYKEGQGKLYFDPDGTGAQAQVLIATLSGAPALSAADFIVI